MGTHTAIEWCDFTFNPWRGCAKVSPGCTNCYAEAMSKRNPAVLGTWGKDGTRAIGTDAYWRQPLKWNRDAAKAGERRRVFCASLADVFEDRPDLVEPRFRLFAIIERTPALDWLLLTKRPENIERLWPAGSVGLLGAPNIWLGTTVEDQDRADERIPRLLATPAAVRFLSVEPLLGPVDLFDVDGVASQADPLGPFPAEKIDWVIVGGESGPGARPCDVDWIRSVVGQCRKAGVPCFVKQTGAYVTDRNDAGFDAMSEVWADGEDAGRPVRPGAWPEPLDVEDDEYQDHQGASVRVRLSDRKGGDPAEWPTDLRVREFPRPASGGKEAT